MNIMPPLSFCLPRCSALRLGFAALLLAPALALATPPTTTAARSNATGAVHTADELKARIDALFADHDRVDSPGAAVSVYRRGHPVFASGYGRADLEAGTPLTARTPIHVASVSKQFTAFAIALLARDGKVALDADIRTYLPWVPDLGSRITVRHLILHTSGLRDQWSLFTLGGQEMGSRLRQQQIVNMVRRQQALNFAPGTEYSYSNTGYTLLAEIVRAASGKSLRAFADERIFQRLKMTRTFFFDDVTEVVPGRANSYSTRPGGKAWRRELLNYDNAGATSLFTTAEDLAKWAANFTAPVVGDKALIEEISTPGTLFDGSPLDYAFGLSRGKRAGRSTIEHSGSDAGFRSLFVYYPEHDFAVSVLANTQLALSEKVEAIADLYLPGTKPAAITLPAVVEVPERLRDMEGFYLAPHDTALRLDSVDGKLGYTVKRGDTERRLSLTLRADDSLDDGERRGAYFKVVRDPAGQVNALDAHDRQGKLRTRYRRLAPPAAPSAEELQAYAGDYHSNELDITYSVRLAADKAAGLVVDSIWMHEPVMLRKVAEDRFEGSDWQFGTVLFQRNGTGGIQGLLLHAGRIRNVALTRLRED